MAEGVPLRFHALGRTSDVPGGILLLFTRDLTEAERRELSEVLHRWASGQPGPADAPSP